MDPLSCFLHVSINLKSGLILSALVLLLVFSSFFSACETAFSSVNMIRLKNLNDEKKKGARRALYLAERFDKTLVTLLVGNNLVNIAATTIAAYFIGTLIKSPGIANLVNTLGMTIIILIFGEITPKSYAKENPEKLALKYANILFVVDKILWPFTCIFYQIRKFVLRKSRKDETPMVTEEELETIIDTMEDEGVIENDDAELIQNALDINEIEVFQIMTPRVDMIAASINEDTEKIKAIFFENQYSRIPVYDQDKDNIIGILRERDFFTAYINSPAKTVDIKAIMSSPYFVSRTMKVDDLIREMQKQKQHFAVVLDEYGGTSGIVTLEDALEELVGEIYDEYDEAPELNFSWQKLDENKYLVNPAMDLEDLFTELHLGKKPDSTYRDVGAFVYELCEEVPKKGLIVKYQSLYEDHDVENPQTKKYELAFMLDRVIKRRIKSLILTITDITKENQG